MIKIWVFHKSRSVNIVVSSLHSEFKLSFIHFIFYFPLLYANMFLTKSQMFRVESVEVSFSQNARDLKQISCQASNFDVF